MTAGLFGYPDFRINLDCWTARFPELGLLDFRIVTPLLIEKCQWTRRNSDAIFKIEARTRKKTRNRENEVKERIREKKSKERDMMKKREKGKIKVEG